MKKLNIKFIKSPTFRIIGPGKIPIDFDPIAMVAYIHLGKGKIAATEEISPWILCHFNSEGEPLTIEILRPKQIRSASKKEIFRKLARKFSMPELRKLPGFIPQPVPA